MSVYISLCLERKEREHLQHEWYITEPHIKFHGIKWIMGSRMYKHFKMDKD